ncbi:MAG: HD domain-containing protein, partial [Leptospiraceae bacterium]|nr:HD domain-containing protein [Leptospiraceae bacterium]
MDETSKTNEPEVDHKVSNLVGGELGDEQEKKIDVSTLKVPVSSKVQARQTEIADKIRGSLRSLSNADVITRDKVIEHVGQALADIDDIESKPELDATAMDETLDRAIPKLQMYMDDVIRTQSLHKDLMAMFIGDLIDTTGPNRDTTKLFLNIEYSGVNFLTNHTLNVMLLSISLGIELSKLMEKKLTLPEISSDLKKILICNRKIFTRNELIDLGIAALLHDIHYRITFPELSKDKKFTLKEESVVERHAAESYHYLKQHFPGLDYEIVRSVYQHHEYLDGTGTPNGVSGRMIARYRPILSFADHYILGATENPFQQILHPNKLLQNMMTKDRNKFDDDILLAFIRGAG